MAKVGDEGRVHVLAVPYRSLHGHVNPMLSFCKTLISHSRHSTARDVHVTLVVKKHLLSNGEVEAGSHDGRLRFLEVEAEQGTEAEEEEILERLLETALEEPPKLMVADCFVNWAVDVGRRRNIPVASFWPASASTVSIAYHRHMLQHSYQFPLDPLHGEERIDFIPGISSIRLVDLPGEIPLNDREMLDHVSTSVSTATKAQCIIFRTTNELEEAALVALKAALNTDVGVPVYAVGPSIRFPTTNTDEKTERQECYMNWLDTQQENSVLYISLGTYLSISDSQLDELVIGVKDSGIPFLLVAQDQADRLNLVLGDHKLGKVVAWCDQMRVLSHPCIGGFLTHCGWNSTLEAVFVGVPTLTFPLGLDQNFNSKLIVEDWGVGWRMKNNFQDFVTRDRIAELLNKFMNLENPDRKELDNKCKKFKERLLLRVGKDGSTSDLDEFIAHTSCVS